MPRPQTIVVGPKNDFRCPFLAKLGQLSVIPSHHSSTLAWRQSHRSLPSGGFRGWANLPWHGSSALKICTILLPETSKFVYHSTKMLQSLPPPSAPSRPLILNSRLSLPQNSEGTCLHVSNEMIRRRCRFYLSVGGEQERGRCFLVDDSRVAAFPLAHHVNAGAATL